MRHAAALRFWLAVAATGCAAALAGCGSTNSRSTTATTSSSPVASRLSVSPVRGGPATRFALRFVAPASSGPAGSSRVGFTLSLSGGSGGGGCIGARSVAVPAATRGLPVTVALDPSSLGGAWCPGAHTARVIEVQGPICNPGTLCPQYLRVVGTVGEATFTTGGSA